MQNETSIVLDDRQLGVLVRGLRQSLLFAKAQFRYS
jgi:hypothetical protein